MKCFALILLVLGMFLGACSPAGNVANAPVLAKKAENAPAKENPTPTEEPSVWILVDGMTKVQGITWVGWPNQVQTALEGLHGVTKLEVDLARDLFHVTYNPEHLTTAAMLEAIEGVGFKGQLVDAPTAVEATGLQLDLDSLPGLLRDTFALAAKERRHVLIDVHGPGWAPCVRMERVTLPSDVVQAVLKAHYVRQLLDLEEHKAESAVLKPEAIPVSIVFDAGGREVGRKVGFVPPEEFATWLKECLAK